LMTYMVRSKPKMMPKLPTSIISTPSTRYENFCKQQTKQAVFKGAVSRDVFGF
jgi:hypothetical protein